MTFKVFKHKLQSKGRSLTFIIHPGKFKIATGYHCREGSWDQRSQSVRATGVNKDPQAPAINTKLKLAAIHLQGLIDRRLDIYSIRGEYEDYLRKSNGHIEIEVSDAVPIYNLKEYDKLTHTGKQFYRLIDKLIHSHRSDWAEGYKKRFRTIRTKFLAFEPNFQMSMLTEDWWREFVTYCIEELDNVNNTINTDTKTISALMGELGMECKFSWSYIEPEILGLSWEKVLKLDSPKLIEKILAYPKATLNDSRKLWLAGAFTGRRWTEISTVGPQNFYQKDGKWRYKNIGKGQKMLDIPLLKEAVDFFKKNKFKLPKLANQTVNEDIKIICRLAGFKDPIHKITPVNANKVNRETFEEWETVHFHTSRHSYCHHIVELFAGKPNAEKTISWLMGHSSYQTTWKYLNKAASSNEQMFDEAVNI